MAKDIRIDRHLGGQCQKQTGFTLVELLIAAFILAIGILGVLMLQATALRATRGSSNMGVATRLAEQVMGQADKEGRLSWLNLTDSNRAAPSLADLNSFSLKYITIESGGQLVETFNILGGSVDASNPDPTVSNPYFTVATRRVAILGAPAGAVGEMSDFHVRVTFVDTIGSDSQPITRTFNLSRRISHG